MENITVLVSGMIGFIVGRIICLLIIYKFKDK